MNLTVNGETVVREGPLVLQQFLESLQSSGARVAVLVNDAVVSGPARATLPLKDGDRIEILTFTAGG